MTKVWGRVLTMRISTFIEPFKQKMPTAIKPKTFFPLETLCVQQCMHKHAWVYAAACGTLLHNACVCVGGGVGVGGGGYCLGVLFRFLKKREKAEQLYQNLHVSPYLSRATTGTKTGQGMPKKKRKKKGIITQLTNSACTHLDTHMVVNTGVIPPKRIGTTTYCLPSLRASLKPRFRSSETKQNWLYNLYCSSASSSTPHIFDKVHLICLQDSTWYLW